MPRCRARGLASRTISSSARNRRPHRSSPRVEESADLGGDCYDSGGRRQLDVRPGGGPTSCQDDLRLLLKRGFGRSFVIDVVVHHARLRHASLDGHCVGRACAAGRVTDGDLAARVGGER